MSFDDLAGDTRFQDVLLLKFSFVPLTIAVKEDGLLSGNTKPAVLLPVGVTMTLGRPAEDPVHIPERESIVPDGTMLRFVSQSPTKGLFAEEEAAPVPVTNRLQEFAVDVSAARHFGSERQSCEQDWDEVADSVVPRIIFAGQGPVLAGVIIADPDEGWMESCVPALKNLTAMPSEICQLCGKKGSLE